MEYSDKFLNIDSSIDDTKTEKRSIPRKKIIERSGINLLNGQEI